MPRSPTSRTNCTHIAASPTDASARGPPSSVTPPARDPLWQAARALADEHGVGMSFHMSPAKIDPDGFIAEFGQRPDGPPRRTRRARATTCAMTHCVHVDDHELDRMAATGSSVAHCPTTALKVSYGVTQIGKMPEMVQRGINVSIGTDGNNASNYSDLMRATYLVAGLFKDGRMDPQMFPAEKAYEMATLGGARIDGPAGPDRLDRGGQAADVVLHDTDRPEWRPLLNVVNQLVWSADGRGVHTVRGRRPHRGRGRPHDDDRRGRPVERGADGAAKRSSGARGCPTAPSSRCGERQAAGSGLVTGS